MAAPGVCAASTAGGKKNADAPLSRPCGRARAVVTSAHGRDRHIHPHGAPGRRGQIARVHDAAWREAYQGVIPGRELERMILRRGPAWWRQAIRGGTRLHGAGLRATPWRAMRVTAATACRRSPTAARSSSFTSRRNIRAAVSAGGCSMRRATIWPRIGYLSFVVWALAGNDRALEFYRRLGGAMVRRAPETLRRRDARARRFRFRVSAVRRPDLFPGGAP